MGFAQNDEDELVETGVATPSQEIQEEEPMAEDGSDGDIPVAASPSTPHTPARGHSATSGSLETRLAFLETSIIDLKGMHIDMWTGF